MAQHDPDLNLYVLDATDVDPFVIPDEDGAANVIGDGRDNVITGNSGANSIDGGGGNDILYCGSQGEDTLLGGPGDDSLFGSNGVDILKGGLGNDTYKLHIFDEIIEYAGEGVDTIITNTHYVLPDHVENLVSGSDFGFKLTGNDLDNVLIGGGEGNHLDGGIGADTLQGGAGEDFYYIDDEGDVIIETQPGAKDIVYSSVSYTLGENLEVLDAVGVNKNLVLIGNSLDNFIYAHMGANTIDGGAGADIMVGGAGNDTYYIDNANDMIAEFSGIDTVITRVSFRIEDQEILKAIGSSPVSLTGDGFANTITGNIGKNTIKAGGGNDRLNGGYGSDVLYGGAGRDVFTFRDKLSKTSNLDRVVDYRVADDTIYLENAIFRKLTKTGTLSGTNFVLGSKAKDKNDYIVYDKVKGYLYYDADGSGSGAAVAFAKLATGLKMAASEFKVI